MKGTIKVAALAALLASAAAFAGDPNQPAQSAEPQTPADTTMGTEMDTANALPEFSTLDTNGDGAISQDEARAQSLVASRFGELDGDKNGKLSSDEYKKAVDRSKAPNP